MYLLCISDMSGHIWYYPGRNIFHNFPFSTWVCHTFSQWRPFSWRVRHFIKSSSPGWILWEKEHLLAPLLVWRVIGWNIFHKTLSSLHVLLLSKDLDQISCISFKKPLHGRWNYLYQRKRYYRYNAGFSKSGILFILASWKVLIEFQV